MMNVFRAVIFACVMGMVHGQYEWRGNNYTTCGALAADGFFNNNKCDQEMKSIAENAGINAGLRNCEYNLFGYYSSQASENLQSNILIDVIYTCCITHEYQANYLQSQVTYLQNDNVCASDSGQSEACDQRILDEYTKTQIIALYNKGVEQGKFDTCG